MARFFVCRWLQLEYKNQLEVGVKEEDKDILEQLKSFLCSTYPIKIKKKIDKKYNKVHVGYRIITSKEITDNLYKYGCTPHKSLTLKWPNELKKEYTNHFIRGYLDGDGGIYKHKNQKTSMTR